MKVAVLDKAGEFLARFRGETRERYRRALAPYYAESATVQALRRAYVVRLARLPAQIMRREKVALQLFLGRPLHAKSAKGEQK